MKEYKMGYVENNNVYEVKAFVSEEKKERFLNKLANINLKDYKKSKIVHQKFVDIISPVDCEYSEADIKNEFVSILNKRVIDLNKFISLICSDNELFNKKFVELLDEFINMFDYELALCYNKDEFDQLYRMTMTFGSTIDKKDLNAISLSLINNTRIIKKFLHIDVLDKEPKKVYTLLTKK